MPCFEYVRAVSVSHHFAAVAWKPMGGQQLCEEVVIQPVQVVEYLSVKPLVHEHAICEAGYQLPWTWTGPQVPDCIGPQA